MGTPLTRRSIRIGRRHEGQSVVEFMLMLPFFFLFILLVIEFGLFMWASVSVANASREGARYASANCGAGVCTEEQVRDWLLGTGGTDTGRIGTGVRLQPEEITVAWPVVPPATPGAQRPRGSPVAVEIDHQYQLFFVPSIMSIFNSTGQNTIPIRSCTEMRLEQQESAPQTAADTGCGN